MKDNIQLHAGDWFTAYSLGSSWRKEQHH